MTERMRTPDDLDRLAAENKQLHRTIELLNEYGTARFGDEWWPGNPGCTSMPEADQAELLRLLGENQEQQHPSACRVTRPVFDNGAWHEVEVSGDPVVRKVVDKLYGDKEN